MTIKLIETGVLILLALANDIRNCRISNKITYPFIIIGIITNVLVSGWNGFLSSITGVFIPVIILLLLFVLRMLGAGDIKLFSAIGSIMGAGFIIYNMAISFIAGGIIALVILLFNKSFKQRFLYFLNYIKSCISCFLLLPYGDFRKDEKGMRFRFAYAAAIGTVIQVIFML